MYNASKSCESGNSIASSGYFQNKDVFARQLSENYRLPLISYFYRRVSDNAEAEDLTQEVFVRVMRKAEECDIDNVEAFLFNIATNLLRDRIRRSKVRLKYQQSESGNRQNHAEELSPERVTIAKEELQNVIQAMTGLNERTRDIFILHRLENMKNREIAEMYGVSVSAIEKHMTKAIVHLAKYMNKA